MRILHPSGVKLIVRLENQQVTVQASARLTRLLLETSSPATSVKTNLRGVHDITITHNFYYFRRYWQQR